ncbi:MAG: c-type cytochrome [Novosphingobium sp.]
MLKVPTPALVLAAPALALVLLAACAPAPSPGAAVPLSPSAQRGLAFARANCARCHAVEGSGASPNAEAPAFAAIANMPGLTGETLREFLRDSHNFPAAMNFTVEPSQIDDLADYAVSLKRPDYKPDI